MLNNDLKNIIDSLSDKEKEVLLCMTMESLRGYWGNAEERISIVHYLCTKITTLPEAYLKAVENNANNFDGTFVDGRIFRDGSRESGMSGNLAFCITGDDRILQDGYYGTYTELWNILKKNASEEELVSIMKLVYHLVLIRTHDMTFEDYRYEQSDD